MSPKSELKSLDRGSWVIGLDNATLPPTTSDMKHACSKVG